MSASGGSAAVNEIASFETKAMNPLCYEKVNEYTAQKEKEGKVLSI